jgi:site-specific DNA recombinase
VEEQLPYSFSPKEIAAYLEKADKTVLEKEQLLAVQQVELQKVQRATARAYQLYQDGQLDSVGFGKFYKPLEERAKQLGESIPRLQAEIDLCKVNNLSAEEVASEAANLHKTWPTLKPEEKRQIVETIVEKIIIGKGEITINLCYLPPCKEMALGWRKGWDSNPRWPCDHA